MEVHLSPEKQAKLQDFAARTGREASQFVVEAVDRMLEYDARFIEAVEVGGAQARRGELIDHDEVAARIEGLFQS
jgi:predicted transcriptional regulator